MRCAIGARTGNSGMSGANPRLSEAAPRVRSPHVANYALLEWPENIDIGKTPPTEYVPEIQKRFNGQEALWTKTLADHALPESWEKMTYQKFLEERRKLMAGIIKQGFESLA